jgi:hypothetical protein
MIFLSIIALFFGFLMVSFLLVLEAKMGLIFSALLIAVFGFLGSGRLAHNRPLLAMIIGAVGTLLPLWLLPAYTAAKGEFPKYLLPLAIITLSVLGGILVTVWMQRRHEQ